MSLWKSCVNSKMIDIVLIQYLMVRVGSTNDNAWRMPVSDSNTCSGVRSFGIVGWARSVIVTAGVVDQMNWGKDVAALEIHPLLPQRIRAKTYRCS